MAPAPPIATPAHPHRSAAHTLAWLFIGLIVYASLHPFTSWRWQEPPSSRWFALPWPPYHDRFDIGSNFVGYMPLGLLWCIGRLRDGGAYLRGALEAILICAGLSYAMEVIQHTLPTRVPSALDWLLNTAGGVAGAGLALLAQQRGWVDSLRARRDRWLLPHSGNGQALLLLWPVGLLFPPAVPFGLGQVFNRLSETLQEAAEGTPFETWMPVPIEWDDPLSAGTELLTVALGLLAPVLVAYAISARPRPRLKLLLLCVVLGASATTLSTTLNFGPAHALAWLTPPVLPGFVLASVMGASLAWVPRRAIAGIGLLVLTSLCALINQAPTDPYFALSLNAWEQGRFIRFHGLAQWVGWLWPYIAILWLLVQIGAPASEPGAKT
jgi:VanZ family protein